MPLLVLPSCLHGDTRDRCGCPLILAAPVTCSWLHL
jgi:hypothetical protein